MDSIDYALINALARLTPGELARRVARAHARAISRPVRPWCIALCASDTRLDQGFIAFSDEHAPAQRRPHDLFLTSAEIARLAKPVVIDWPGLDWTRAADLLGRHPESLRRWIARGVFKLARYNARSCSKRGKPVPHIWARSPLDPNADEAHAPDPVWGTIWQSLHERIPPDLEFELRRLPHFIAYPTRTAPQDAGPESAKAGIPARKPTTPTSPTRFRGWRFICPGLPSEPPCGRLVDRLFLPLPIATLLADAIQRGLVPPNTAPIPWSHPFAPACHHCHRVQYFTLATRNGWNLFVHHISAGLLQGSDVAKPTDLIIKRKRAPKSQRPRPTPQRDRVHKLLLTTLTTDEIAARLGIKRVSVYSHAETIYKLNNVHSRRELRQATAPRLAPQALPPALFSPKD